MVIIQNSGKGLCCVGLFLLVIWPKPHNRDCIVAGVRSAMGSKEVTTTIPTTIVNISLLHLNSGLMVNIFDNWRRSKNLLSKQ